MLKSSRLRITPGMAARMFADTAMIQIALIAALGLRLFFLVAFQNEGGGADMAAASRMYLSFYCSSAWPLTAICLIIFYLNGFYTFAVGTRAGFAVLRDPIACKHAVLAETDDWVAMATEYRAIATLPGADQAEIWEPVPGRIYTWEHN